MSDCLICGEPVDPTVPGALVQRFASEALPDVAYCPKHAGRAIRRERKPRRKGFRLTAGERAGILAGEHPRIERGKDDPPADAGTTIEVSANVGITILGSGVNKLGRRIYRYDPWDQRLDLPRLLRRTPPALRPEQAKHDRVHPPTAAEIRQASEDSAYASGGRRDTLIADAGEAPPRAYENELAVRSRLRHAERIVSEIGDGD